MNIQRFEGKIWCLALVLLLTAAGVMAAEKKRLGEGEDHFRALPHARVSGITFAGGLSPEERTYLGLSGEGPFSLEEVPADLVFLEFLNVYCLACQLQAPFMNQAYRMVQARDDLRDRVRFLGVAVGNGAEEIQLFKEDYGIPYPILADPDLAAYEAVGNPGGTPLLILYAPRPVAGEDAYDRIHLGLLRPSTRLLSEIENALATAPATPVEADTAFQLGSWRDLEPDLTEAERLERLKQAAAEIGLVVERIESVTLADGEEFYRLHPAGAPAVWAKVAGRAKICNVCHDIFFILLFDDSGKVVNFTPIHVTKYENVPFDEHDTAFMKDRVIGRFLTEEIVFRREVDAVSTATMSSRLIFDTVRRLRSSYAALREKGMPVK